MKSKTIANHVIASLLATSFAACAQPFDDGRHAGPALHNRQEPDGHPALRDRGAEPHDAYAGRAGGPIPHADWHQGERLPAAFRDRSYVVDDWRGHGLQVPPRGYQWVGVSGDYVLVAIATGVIANILLSSH